MVRACSCLLFAFKLCGLELPRLERPFIDCCIVSATAVLRNAARQRDQRIPGLKRTHGLLTRRLDVLPGKRMFFERLETEYLESPACCPSIAKGAMWLPLGMALFIKVTVFSPYCNYRHRFRSLKVLSVQECSA